MESYIEIDKIAMLQKYVLSASPFEMFDLKEILGADCIITESLQKEVLEKTVLLPRVKSFQIKLSYQRAFLKAFMTQVEESGGEICGDLYSAYCALLVQQEQFEDFHFRHYVLPEGAATIPVLIVKESSNIVTDGTTGLYTWQASKALAEWCLSHRAVLEGKRVLELGSGTGLAGLVACLCCDPVSVFLSDCHPTVLDVLEENVCRNFAMASGASGGTVATYLACEDGDLSLYRARFRNTTIEVINLPWESIPRTFPVRDIILAADVVYDSTLFQPLCDAFLHLTAKQTTDCTIVLACTVRDSDTLNNFFCLLESNDLYVTSEEQVQPTVFVYSHDPPVKIYTIAKTPS